MKQHIVFPLLAACLFCTPVIAFSSSKTCPDEVLAVDRIEGVYIGVEEGDFSWLVLDVEGETMSVMVDSEEVETAFGQNAAGKQIVVEYEIQQFWNEYGNECSRLNVFKSGKLAGSGPKVAHSKQVEILFQPETLGSTIAYLEHMVGPARKINGNEREYVIDGCKVFVWGTTDIESLELELSPTCTFDVSKFTGDTQPMPAHELTFGQIGGEITADCLYDCGNMFDPSVMSTYVGPRANGWIDIQATAFLVGDVGDAVRPWLEAMLKTKGEAWVTEGSFNCDKQFQGIAQKSMQNVQAEKIKVGHDLGQQCP